jgi:MFS family permease
MASGPVLPEHSGEKRSLLRVFRHRTFLLIWCAAAFSNIGNWMEGVAQGWAVIQQTQDDPRRSAFLSELLSVADFAPVLFLALIAGVIADRVNRKIWLMILQASACLLGTALAVIAYMGLLSPYLVITFTFVEGIVWALNGPVWMSVVPQLVPREELEFATAANSLQFNLARLLGPVLAGAIIGISGVSLAFAINALTFLPVLIALFWLPDQGTPRIDSRESITSELFSGVRYTWNHPGARRLALMSMTFTFFSAPLQGLLAIFARQVLGGTSTLYGVMLGAIGLGSITGALSLGKVPAYYPRHHLIPVAMFMFSIFGVAYTFSHTPWISIALLYCCGVCWLLALNPMNTATQLLASDDNRGRVLSVMLLCAQGAMPFGHLCAGALSYYMTPEHVLRSMLGILFVIAMYFLFRREPAIDQMDKRVAQSRSLLEQIHEAITAHSHRPATPSESVRVPRPGSYP